MLCLDRLCLSQVHICRFEGFGELFVSEALASVCLRDFYDLVLEFLHGHAGDLFEDKAAELCSFLVTQFSPQNLSLALHHLHGSSQVNNLGRSKLE